MSHPTSTSTSTSNPNKRSSPHSAAPSTAAAAAAAPILPAMKKAKSQPLDGNKNGQQHNTAHVHFSDNPALSPMMEDDPNDAVLDASSPSSAFGRSSAASAGGVTANLSRKKATPPQPTKKLVIKLNKEMMKKRKKDERKNKDDNTVGSDRSVQHKKSPEKVEDHTQLANEDGNAKTNHEGNKKKKHKSKENFNDDLAAAQQEYADNDTNSLLNTNETQNSEAECTNKRKKKKTKILKNGSDDRRDIEAESANKGKKRKPSLVVNGSDGTSPNKSSKKVRFSDQDEIFPLPSNSNTEEGHVKEDNLVRGKRFTREEDELVKDAVLKYIEEHALGDEGLDMVLSCSKHPKLKGCWKEIASAIPYRPYIAVYCRARILFMRSENRKWTKEEYDMIKKYQEEHGNQWRALADELGKHTWHVKDCWRRIKLPNLKKGHWSQDEYQKLFDLVNTDLQLKVSEEKISKHGMLRDNISWTAISDSLSSRTQATCCLKWYKQMTSPMVAEGVWSDSDDYRLISELYSLDATCLEDVDWDDLIDNRSGDVCRKRWSQMVLHMGHHGNKSFAEQVEVLAQRYCPYLLEARETWDNKPRVP